jgi:hypothetical protein
MCQQKQKLKSIDIYKCKAEKDTTTLLYKYKNLRITRDMWVLVASLGFSYHHVMAATNRCRPGKLVLATVNPENERTKNAIAEIRRYAAVANAAVEVKTLNPEDFWRCVGDALDLFAEKHHYYLDVGGGVRALGLCLCTAAMLAVAHLGADLIAVYTMAEHTEKIVEADLRPLLYANKLMDARAKTRRDTLRNLQKGAVEPTPTAKRILVEFENTASPQTANPPPPPTPS